MKAKLKAMQVAATKVAGRGSFILKQKSPELMLGAGVVGIGVGMFLACKATLKAEDTLDVAKDKFDKIKQAKALGDAGTADYSKQDYQKDIAIAYVQTAADFTKLYAPAVGVTMVSLGLIIGSHGIMRKRNFALMAAYKAVDEAFASYRARVVEDLGVEKDHQFKTGYKKEVEVVVGVDENGKKIKTRETHDILDPRNQSEYARFFDEASTHWTRSPEYNLTYVLAQQQYANDLLQARGHVFLNEVYDMLGIPRTNAGAVVGWVKGHGDDFVDFGIFEGKRPVVRDFVNGYETSILLDFNVDGTIYGLI